MDCFYKDGLPFSCQPNCLYCCAVEPGFVFLSQYDLDRLTSYTHTSIDEFIKTYCVKVPMGETSYISLKERPNHDCIFLTSKGCSVYDARPVQCSTYPFWSSVIESKETWENEKQWCPGINKGERHTKEEIEIEVNRRVEHPPLIYEEIFHLLGK
ncbi:MAG: YkgJ family cysteine cluster protein [Spirochaetia bacterium]|nr:YkgJ family cysteine cluster protein [Spirochaetia bacterium]